MNFSIQSFKLLQINCTFSYKSFTSIWDGTTSDFKFISTILHTFLGFNATASPRVKLEFSILNLHSFCKDFCGLTEHLVLLYFPPESFVKCKFRTSKSIFQKSASEVYTFQIKCKNIVALVCTRENLTIQCESVKWALWFKAR